MPGPSVNQGMHEEVIHPVVEPSFDSHLQGLEDEELDDSESSPLLTALPPRPGEDEQSYRTRESSRTEQWLVYICFMGLGLGTLLPWNFFITAESYWQYKFRNTTNATVAPMTVSSNTTTAASAGVTEDLNPASQTELQLLYTPMLVCLSQITNLSCLVVNALFSHKLPVRLRLVSTLIAMMVMFTVTTILVEVNSDTWQLEFFIVTMFIIVFLNSSGALFQGGLFGLAGMFPPCYMAAVVTGQALGGVFAAATRIFSLMAGADDITSAFIFFSIAVVVMTVTLGALFYLMRTDLYHDVLSMAEEKKTASRDETQPLNAGSMAAESRRVFCEIWPIGLAVTVVFWITLAVYPAVCVNITSVYSQSTTWASVYFQPVMTFLLFNVGDYVGRLLAGWLLWPRRGSRLVYAMVGARVIFIPLLLMCNHPASDSIIPSLYSSDVAYFFIMLFFALTNGYCGSICMIYGPKMVSNPDDAERAGSLMAAMLGLGLLGGAFSSFGFGLIL